MALPVHLHPNNQIGDQWFYTENPSWLTFRASDDYLSAMQNQFALCNLGYVNELIASGEQITIEWEGNQLTFTFAVLPLDDSGNQLRENSSGTIDYSLYYIFIVNGLINNCVFAQNFSIVASGSGFVQFIAQKPNMPINVTVTTSQMSAAVINPPAILPNYSLVFLLTIGSGNVQNISIYQKPDQYGFVRIDIAPIMRNYVPWITPNDLLNGGIASNIETVDIKFTEQYGSPATPKRLQNTQTMRFIKGGVLWEEETSNLDPHPTGETWQQKKFLTRQPTQKNVSQRQPEWLCWLQHDSSIWCIVHVECHFEDGSVVYNSNGYWVLLEQYAITPIPVSYDHLNAILNLDGGTGVRPMYCRIVLYDNDNNTEISAPQSYHYIDCHFADRYIVVANRWGGVDTILLAAPAEKSIKTTEKITTEINQDFHVDGINGGIPVPFLYDFEGQQKTVIKKTKEVIKTDTSYIYPKDHLQWLKDCLRMPQMWEIANYLTIFYPTFMPIDILSDNIIIETESDDLTNIAIEYTYRIEN